MPVIKVLETEGEYTIQLTNSEAYRITEWIQEGITGRIIALAICRRLAKEQGIELPYNRLFDSQSPPIMEVESV
jgi:hypothetical protein